MLPLQCLRAILLATMLLPCGLRAETAAELYARIQATPAAGECIEIDIDPSLPGVFSTEADESGSELIYPMTHNNVAEGWSWQPGADPSAEDYYRFKYLPLGSEHEERGEYPAEDQIGEVQTMKIRWRYDYFLAFDNFYDFQHRNTNAETGFASHLEGRPVHPPGLRATACLQNPATTESTTFWKATHGQPVDFTLKKRYLIGKLESLKLIDVPSGRVLSTIKPQPPNEH